MHNARRFSFVGIALSLVLQAPVAWAFPRDTRIAIVGTGPAGLSAARALLRQGYTRVTLFEREEHVGGKVSSFTYDGEAHDIGAVVMTEEYRATLRLAREAGVETEPYLKPTLVVDTDGEILDFQAYGRKHYSLFDMARSGTAFLAMQGIRPHPFSAGLTGLGNDLSLSFQEFVNKQGLEPVAQVARPVIVGCGYGYYETIPAAYHAKVFQFLFNNGIREFTRSGLGLGHSPFLRVKGGFQSLWDKVAAPLDVRLRSEVVAVSRASTEAPIRLRLRGEEGWRNFDKLIVASPLPEALKYLDASPLERELFSKIKSIKYISTLFTGEGIPEGRTYYPARHLHPDSIGHVVQLGSFARNEKVWTAYQQSAWQTPQETLDALFRNDVAELGGTVKEVLAQRTWSYFPHVDGDELRAGFYERLESLQGANSTYYIGSVMNFETVEHTALYSEDLVRREFQ